MQRFQNWQIRMDRFLAENRARAFAWGDWDCALMAAAHIDALTGSSLYAAHAGQYTTREESAAYLSTIGVDDLTSLARLTLGEPLSEKRKAQRGDIVTFDTAEGPALGIVDLTGMRIAGLSPSCTGFIFLPVAYATAAWRV